MHALQSWGSDAMRSLQSWGSNAMYALQLYRYYVCSAEVSSALHVDCLLGILLEDCFQSTIMQIPWHTCVSGRVLGLGVELWTCRSHRCYHTLSVLPGVWDS